MGNKNIVKKCRSILILMLIVYIATVGFVETASAVPSTSTYTGCLSNVSRWNLPKGVLYNVQVGTAPVGTCLSGDKNVSFVNATYVNSIEARLARIETILAGVTRSGNDIYINKANVHIRSGSGKTDGTVNGLGNLIIGYNELKPSNNNRTGSHNLIIGRGNNYKSYGGLVAGYSNEISGPYTSVSGGALNTASGLYASVSGGLGNTASGGADSVSGGNSNTARGGSSTVSGGWYNSANGTYSSVSGGNVNTASGDRSSISGGNYNTASGFVSSISGGGGNTARGLGSSVSGGRGNRAGTSPLDYEPLSEYASVSGGTSNIANGMNSSVSGGYGNIASGDSSSISGGTSNRASGQYSSVSGGSGNIANGTRASISGGSGGIAGGWSSSISGGCNRVANYYGAWKALDGCF